MHLAYLAAAGTLLSTASATVLPLRRRTQAAGLANLTAWNTPTAYRFDTNVVFGNQEFAIQVDTGSSDTWVVGTAYRCFNLSDTSIELPQSDCTYAPSAPFDISSSPTFSLIANQTFGAHYGAGIALGSVGTESVSLGGGLTAHNQTVGVVYRASIPGDGVNSGILGLGYPALTSAHPGTSVANDTVSLLTNKVVYDPLVITLWKQGAIEAPWFSLALERQAPGSVGGDGGFLGLAELPPAVETVGDFVSVPVEITEAIPLALTDNVTQITEWTLSVDSVTWWPRTNTSATSATSTNNSSTKPSCGRRTTHGTGGPPATALTNTTRFQAVVDNGNYFNQLPTEIAAGILAAYDPPPSAEAIRAAAAGGLTPAPVSCSAAAPALGLAIGGRTFWHRPEDLVVQLDDGTGLAGPCVATVMGPAGGSGGGGGDAGVSGLTLNFLGDAFLHNVVAVFDQGADEMRFAARADSVAAAAAGH